MGALARAARTGHPPEGDLHRSFGQRLFDTVFDGSVGELWQERLASARREREPLRLVVQVDQETARPLLNLRWEYPHDGHDFLALQWRTAVSRLPWGLPSESLPPLAEPLRLLVVVAAPSDLAVGILKEDMGTTIDAGAVHVLYGSADGITATNNQLWHQDSA